MKIIILIIFSILALKINSQQLNCNSLSNDFVGIRHFTSNESSVFFIGCKKPAIFNEEDCEIYTTNGTLLSKIEIIHGTETHPSSLVNFQNNIFFVARNTTGENAIYKIVPPSSVVVVDNALKPQRLNVVNNRLYFTSEDKDYPRAFVKLNTDPGFFNFAQYSTPQDRYNQCKNNIIFNSDNGLGLRVQISPGLPGSRSYVQTNFTNGRLYTPFNNLVYFTSAINTVGTHLVYADCNANRNSTQLFTSNLLSSSMSPSPERFVVFNNFLYIIFSDQGVRSLYKIDTTNTLTKVSNSEQVYNLHAFGSRLYFLGIDYSGYSSLYNLDYQDNIRLITTNFSSSPHFTNFGNTMYFTMKQAGVGEEIFGISISDPDTIFLAADIFTGANSSEPYNLFVNENYIFFQARNSSMGFFACTQASSSSVPTLFPSTVSPTTIEPTSQTITPTHESTSNQTTTSGDFTVNISGKAKKKEEWPTWSIAMCAVAGAFIILSIIVLVTLNMKS